MIHEYFGLLHCHGLLLIIYEVLLVLLFSADIIQHLSTILNPCIFHLNCDDYDLVSEEDRNV